MADNSDIQVYTDPDKVLAASESTLSTLFSASSQAAIRSSGYGSYVAPEQMFLSKIDRFGINPMKPNHVVTGLTFITRPKLCLATMNLKQDRIMSLLNTVDPWRLEFSIRAYLDSKFARSSVYSGLVRNSPWVASDVPFILPITNGFREITGHPDFFIDTETTQGGFFGEDQTIATGSDFNARSYDFNLTVQDMQGGYLIALFLFWVRYIALVRRGTMMAYIEDIEAQRLNYTCSIYRFVFDSSRQIITYWSKATGCFPKAVPIGAIMDVPDRENYIHAAQQFTIPMQVNNVEYMDPIILQEFNMLMSRWLGGAPDAAAKNGDRVEVPVNAMNNFCGVPYIDVVNGANQMKFWAKPEELSDPSESLIASIMSSMDTLKKSVTT